jgi:hypothetical protein
VDRWVLSRLEIGHHFRRRLPHLDTCLLKQFRILELFLHNPNIDLIGEVKDYAKTVLAPS